VKTTPKNNTDAAALYIVGGTSNSTDYPGLQRFTFADAKWETIRPTVAVTQNRLWHNAVYLNTSDSILVYAGSQDGSQHPSSQTFTIQASEPYTVLAYEAIAPPAISPLLMQWTESKAIFIGGSNSNKKAMIFSPSHSWIDSNATLAAPLYSTSSVKAVVINGDDGSKNLYTFDMSVSPNGVNRTVLVDADGNPVQNARPIVEARAVETALDERSARLEEKGNLTYVQTKVDLLSLLVGTKRMFCVCSKREIIVGSMQHRCLALRRLQRSKELGLHRRLPRRLLQVLVKAHPRPEHRVQGIRHFLSRFLVLSLDRYYSLLFCSLLC